MVVGVLAGSEESLGLHDRKIGTKIIVITVKTTIRRR
jgi:hypothetical protein